MIIVLPLLGILHLLFLDHFASLEVCEKVHKRASCGCVLVC